MPTKEALRNSLNHGMCLDECLKLVGGQECTIFKTERFFPTDIILYIPDLELNEINYEKENLTEEAINNIIDNCYSGKDFLDIVGGDIEKAKRLFDYVDWQHPSSAYDAGEIDDEEE